MAEGAPKFEAFEVFHSPERGDSLHSPELAPDESCEAKVDIETYPSDLPFFAQAAQGSLDCDACPVSGTLYGKGQNSDEAYDMALDGARKIVKDNCYRWIIKQQLEGIDRDVVMPDSFLPTDLQPRTT